MTKYFSFNKLLSQPEFAHLDWRGLSQRMNDQLSYSACNEHNMAHFDLAQDYLFIDYNKTTNELKLHESKNKVPWDVFYNPDVAELTFETVFKSPEFDLAVRQKTNSYICYFNLLRQLLHILKDSVPRLVQLMQASCIETDDFFAVFDIPCTQKTKFHLSTPYLFANGIENGLLWKQHEAIECEWDDWEPGRLYLTAYYGLLLPQLNCRELSALDAHIIKLSSNCIHASDYTLEPRGQKLYGQFYQRLQKKLRKRQLELLKTTKQMVSCHDYEHNEMMQQLKKGKSHLNLLIDPGTLDQKIPKW